MAQTLQAAKMAQALLAVLVLWSLWSAGNCQVGTQCELVQGKPSCVAKCPKGVIDLTPIAGQGLDAPKYNDLRDIADYLYSYNPCYDYTEGLCSNVHVCQRSEYNPYLQYTIANAGTEKIYVDNTGEPYVHYTGPSDREVNVRLHCTSSRNIEITTKGDQERFFVYEFDVYGCDVCPGGCHAGVAAGEVGIVLIILVLCAFPAYFIVGVIVMKVKYDANGKDLIPNRIFWMSVPYLIKDGFLFVISPCRRETEGYNEVK